MRSIVKWISPLMLMACLAAVGCTTTPPSGDQQQLMTDAQASYADFSKEDPTLDKFIDNSYGYAIFPSIGKGAIGIGGAYGRGVVYEQGAAKGWTDMTQGSLGVQLGGQTYSELVVFKDKTA